MANLNSFPHVIRDWQGLLQAFLDNAEALASAESQRAALSDLLVRALDLKARQDSYSAVRQQTTQELAEVLDQGREQARRLRGMAKGILGTKNERLVQFNVAPIRKRSRKAKAPEVIPPKEQAPAPLESLE